MDKYIFSALNSYFETLEYIGYVKYSNTETLLDIILLKEIMENYE